MIEKVSLKFNEVEHVHIGKVEQLFRTCSKLDFGQFIRRGERIRHAVPDMAWNFDSVSVRP